MGMHKRRLVAVRKRSNISPRGRHYSLWTQIVFETWRQEKGYRLIYITGASLHHHTTISLQQATWFLTKWLDYYCVSWRRRAPFQPRKKPADHATSSRPKMIFWIVFTPTVYAKTRFHVSNISCFRSWIRCLETRIQSQ